MMRRQAVFALVAASILVAPIPSSVHAGTAVSVSGVALNEMPSEVGAGDAVEILASPVTRRVKWDSLTPTTCHGVDRYAVFYGRGQCRLRLLIGGRLVSVIKTTVRRDPVGTPLASGYVSVTFDANASKVGKLAKKEIAVFRDSLANARKILVLGYATNDGGAINSPWAQFLSMRRAQKVAAYLGGIGVRTSDIATYWFANTRYNPSVSERANRRATIVWIEG